MEVDTSKLYLGMEVKNYKALCQLLGEELLEGNSKEAQLHRWSLNFKWEKQPKKQKIIITKIYLQPLPDIVPDNSTFAKMMQLILMRILRYIPNDTYHFFSNKFWVDVGMVDEKFKKINTSEEKIEELFGAGKQYELIDSETAKNFFEIANVKLKEATKTALKALDSVKLIHYSQEYCVKTTSWKCKGGWRTATKEEENLILEAEQYALDDMKVTKKFFAMSNNGNYYRKTVNDYIHEKNPALFGAAQWIAIVYHKPPQSHYNRVADQIIRELRKGGYINAENTEDSLNNDVLLYLCRIALNDLVINKMIQEARNQYNKSKEKLIEEGTSLKYDKYNHQKYITRTKSDFVSNCIYLVDTLIKLSENTRVIDYEENLDDDGNDIDDLDDPDFI